MTDKEKDFFIPHQPGFQPVIGYRELEKSPQLIVRQTYVLLGLYYLGIIQEMPGNSAAARDYLYDYTLGYLNAAAEGADAYYDRKNNFDVRRINHESREAAGYAATILSYLPDRASSQYHPKGFSRRGSLRPPTTLGQFLARIEELKSGILQVAIGKVEPHATLEAYPPILRTFKFFEVGNRLPIRLTDDETRQKSQERERFNDLLEGIDVSL